MQKKDEVSMSVVRRLPRYYRFLNELNENGIVRISSKELSEKMGFTASQIRQDFNCFGGFGQQGYGYNIPPLCAEIASILGVDKKRPSILIGAGHMGTALISHVPFESLGFELIGVFDNSKKVIGTTINNQAVLDFSNIAEFYKEHSPEMAILCVPKDNVDEVVKELYMLGIKAFWNFSHFDIAVKYPGAIVENVHINDSMMTLSYKLSKIK